MKYYRLVMSDSVKNNINLPKLYGDLYKSNFTEEEYELLPVGAVAYYKYSPSVEITDILMEPTLMVSSKLKKILLMYDREIKAKAVKLFPVEVEINISPEYWVLKIPEIDCLNKEETIINPNGTIQELILNRNDIEEADLFKVKGTLENFVIVSLAVAESILRRKLYGIDFREVKVV